MEIDRSAFENDSGKDQISWRADGQIVLISHKTADTNERIILVNHFCYHYVTNLL